MSLDKKHISQARINSFGECGARGGACYAAE
jgi:hypothetical protein